MKTEEEMITRRDFLQLTGLLTAGFITGCASSSDASADSASTTNSNSNRWYMPDESHQHTKTWLAFIASSSIYTAIQIPEIQKNLANLAITIAKYEPVSMLVRNSDYALAQQLLGGLNSHNYPIELIITDLNDLWIRDTGPSFVLNNNQEKAAVDFNFNGWGEDQVYNYDGKVAAFVANQSGVPISKSSLILEGGCFELDGQGTAIMAESCILNDNRNPNVTKAEAEIELKYRLGLDKIIWLKGIKGRDITDGHTDFYARFAKPGVVIVNRELDPSSYDYAVTRENISILQSATDSQNRPLDLVILDTPSTFNTTFGANQFAPGYVGYYVCNGAVIMQKFGDAIADADAKTKIAAAFPNHVVEQISFDGVASGGGTIHCATQQEPVIV